MEKMGYRHLSADSVGHSMLDRDDVQRQLQTVFGEDVVHSGEVQRKLLASRAFSDRENTEKINAILHPPIRCEILKVLECHTEEGVNTCLEAALLCETGLVERCDWSVFLDCPFELRLERVKSREWDKVELKNRDAQQDERLKADATDICWKGPHNLGSLQRFSLLLDIAFRYEKACASKEKAYRALQQTIETTDLYVQRST